MLKFSKTAVSLFATVSVLGLASMNFTPAQAATDDAAAIADTQPAAGTAFTAANASQAGATERGAFDFVKSMTDRGLKFLADPNSSNAQKTADFSKLLNASFDLDTIGRFALGRYWNTATPAQQKEYLGLFRKMVVDVYSNRFDEYKGQKVEVRSFRGIGNGDTLVSSFLVPPNGGEEVQVDWRVRSKGGSSYKVVDVLVAGVSMSVTQRSDFSSVIQRGGGNIDALIAELKSGGAPTPAAR